MGDAECTWKGVKLVGPVAMLIVRIPYSKRKDGTGRVDDTLHHPHTPSAFYARSERSRRWRLPNAISEAKDAIAGRNMKARSVGEAVGEVRLVKVNIQPGLSGLQVVFRRRSSPLWSRQNHEERSLRQFNTLKAVSASSLHVAKRIPKLPELLA